MKTKILVPKAAKQVDFSIKEPLTDQEKEEDYELNLYISTPEDVVDLVSTPLPPSPTPVVEEPALAQQ